MYYQDSRNEGTGNDQLSIDLIDGAAAVCYVTSEELKYMMVQSWDVGVGKRVMPQAITCILQDSIKRHKAH